ncbi:hypothetical protein KBD08_03685 [Candidatus Babeliales bacterium]|nr:hypothetical protein [Candidatus Babeliales bacterium]
MFKKISLTLCFLLVPMQAKPILLETIGLAGLVALMVKSRIASIVKPHLVRFSKEVPQKIYSVCGKIYQALPEQHVQRIEKSRQAALVGYQKMLTTLRGQEAVTVKCGRLGYTKQTHSFNHAAQQAESAGCGQEAFRATSHGYATQNNFVQNNESKALVHSIRSFFGPKVTHNYYQANPNDHSDYWKGFAVGSNMSWATAWLLSNKSDKQEDKK